jgi:ABC-2 type transport system permease protein
MSKTSVLATRVRNEFKCSWAIAKKDMRVYYLKPSVLMFGVMFPVFMFLSFAVGRNVPAASLIPGLMAITILFSSSSIGPAVIPTERRTKTFERLVSAPISFYTILLGKTLGGLIFSAAIALIPLLIGLAWLGTSIPDPVALVIGVGLSSFSFSAMGIMFASYPTENPGDVMMMLNFVRLPLLFVSGVFIPIEAMPDWSRVIAFASPLTYSNDLIRYGLGGSSYIGLMVDTALLISFGALFLAAGMKFHDRFRQ